MWFTSFEADLRQDTTYEGGTLMEHFLEGSTFCLNTLVI